jgi:hypothetical protein
VGPDVRLLLLSQPCACSGRASADGIRNPCANASGSRLSERNPALPLEGERSLLNCCPLRFDVRLSSRWECNRCKTALTRCSPCQPAYSQSRPFFFSPLAFDSPLAHQSRTGPRRHSEATCELEHLQRCYITTLTSSIFAKLPAVGLKYSAPNVRDARPLCSRSEQTPQWPRPTTE